MSNSIQATGELITASVADRTLTYKLLPFGEPGYTNVGTLTVNKGDLTIPDINTLELNEEHNFQKQIGKFVSVVETDTHIEATVRIVNTSAGDDALVLASEGLRTGISVEISNQVIRNGRLIRGTLTGAGLVVRPAFSNARLSITAADCGETLTKESNMETTPSVEAAEVVSAPVQAAPIHAASDNKTDLAKLTFAAGKSGHSIRAALADQLTTDDDGRVYIGEQNIGELFEARKSERKLVNAVGVKPLSSLYVKGKRKDRTFAVANWAGDKAELPTGKFTTSDEEWKATAKAVAVDIAMELIEFADNADVIADLYEQALDSYVEQTEAELTTYLLAQATAITAPFAPIPAINKAASQLGAIGARMDFIVVSPDVFAELQEINSADAPWWLAQQSSLDIRNGSVNVGGVTLTSNNALPANTILVGDSRAVDYRESKDFRYKALDVAHGGVDVSFIKFRAQKVTDTGAVLKFTAVGTVEP